MERFRADHPNFKQELLKHCRYVNDCSPEVGELAVEYLICLLKGERRRASNLVLQAVKEEQVSVETIYLEVFQNSLYEIGQLWERNKITVAEEHFCTAVTQFIMSQLYDHIFTTTRTGRVLVGACIGGELHEVGIRMVADFFELDGWDTYYLGANVPEQSIVEHLRQCGAHVLALSATMQYHLSRIRQLIEMIRREDALRNVKIMVGGNLFNGNTELWRQVGADGTAMDARTARKSAGDLIQLQ